MCKYFTPHFFVSTFQGEVSFTFSHTLQRRSAASFLLGCQSAVAKEHGGGGPRAGGQGAKSGAHRGGAEETLEGVYCCRRGVFLVT